MKFCTKTRVVQTKEF